MLLEQDSLLELFIASVVLKLVQDQHMLFSQALYLDVPVSKLPSLLIDYLYQLSRLDQQLLLPHLSLILCLLQGRDDGLLKVCEVLLQEFLWVRGRLQLLLQDSELLLEVEELGVRVFEEVNPL